MEQSLKLPLAGGSLSPLAQARSDPGAAAGAELTSFTDLLALAGHSKGALASALPQQPPSATWATTTDHLGKAGSGNTAPASGKALPPTGLSPWVSGVVGISEQDGLGSEQDLTVEETLQKALPQRDGGDRAAETWPDSYLATELTDSSQAIERGLQPGSSTAYVPAPNAGSPALGVVVDGVPAEGTPPGPESTTVLKVPAGAAGEAANVPATGVPTGATTTVSSQFAPPAGPVGFEPRQLLPSSADQPAVITANQEAPGNPMSAGNEPVELPPPEPGSASGVVPGQSMAGPATAPDPAQRVVGTPATAAQANGQADPLDVATGLHEPGWGEELSERVAVHLAQGGRSAELRVNPADLGPVEMRVSVDRDRTVVSFVSHDSAVREAIQDAMPRLRDALGAQGLQLVEARVGADAGSGQHYRGNAGLTPDTGGRPQLDEPMEQVPEPRIVRGGGLLDTYA